LDYGRLNEGGTLWFTDSFLSSSRTWFSIPDIVGINKRGSDENPNFRRGTDFIYYSISQNGQAISVVGGGDTLAAISKKEYLDKITHISTGGGAMLEFIEKGTLPGIEALKHEEIELLP